MSTDTRREHDQPTTPAATSQSSRADVTPIATMTRQPREELQCLALPLSPTAVQAAPDHLDREHVQQGGPSNPCLDDVTVTNNDAARHTLITAIVRRIAQLRLSAAQAAAVLRLTGPRVTRLFNVDIDEFTLEELVDLLPALNLTIEVVPLPDPPE